jgi:hypothetical protein
MIRPVRFSAYLGILVFFLQACSPASIHPYEVLSPGEGEIIIYPGMIEGNFLLSGVIRKSLSTCIDIGGSAIAVPDYDSRSELYFTSEMRYGLWFCCIPEYYVDYLYVSGGAGSYSQMGQAERENAFVLTYGSGLRFNLFGKFIVGVELKAFSIFKDDGRRDRIAFLLGGGLPL